MFRHGLTTFALLALGAVSGAQAVGTRMPSSFELKDFTQTKAESLGDFQGRALLIEFFAYW